MKVVKYIVDALVYAACAVGILTLILMVLNYKMVSIKTGSMEPTINIGDLCIVHEKGKTEEYRQGDIVTFLAGDVYVTHRIASDNGDNTYITMGDANKVADSLPLEEKDILGKVILTIPGLGIFLEYITNPNGKLVLVVGLVILVTLSFILDKVVGTKTKKKKEGESEEPVRIVDSEIIEESDK